MAPNMKASFALNLGGDLRQGLNEVKGELVDLKNVGKQVSVEKLEKLPGIMNTAADATLKTVKEMVKLGDAGKQLPLDKIEQIPRVMQTSTDAIRQTTREVTSLGSEMRSVEASAERAGRAMRRAASVPSAPGLGQRLFGTNGLKPGEEIKTHGLLGAATAIGGAATLVMPTQAYGNFENIARHIAITEGLSAAPAETETKRLMGVFNRDAIESGQSSESIGRAMADLIGTGLTPKQAEALLPVHSRAATAYNITPESLGHPVGALRSNFQIDEAEMPGALSAMALASKSGLFKVPDFAAHLPGIAGQYSGLGMTGREAANRAFASLEIVTRNAKDPSQGATDYGDFLNSLSAAHSPRTFMLDNKGMDPTQKEQFEKYGVKGINLPQLREDARNSGVDIQTAVLAALHERTDNLPFDVRSAALNAMFGNQQSGSAARALLQYKGDYEGVLTRLRAADPRLFNTDFETAHAAPMITNNTGEEVGKQLERRVGEGFEPIMVRLAEAGKNLLTGISTLDGKFPGLADAVLATTGAMLAAVSALAAVGFIAPGVAAGAALLGAGAVAGLPVLLPAAMIGAAMYGDPKMNAPLMDPYSLPMDTAEPHPIALPHGMMNMLNLGEPSAAEPREDKPVQLDLTVRTDPGTTVTVNGDRPRVTVRHHPNPGTTTGRE